MKHAYIKQQSLSKNIFLLCSHFLYIIIDEVIVKDSNRCFPNASSRIIAGMASFLPFAFG